MEAGEGQLGGIERVVVATVVDEVVVGGRLVVVVGMEVVLVVEVAEVVVGGRLVVDPVVVDVTVVIGTAVVVGLQIVKPNEFKPVKAVPFEHLPPMT